MVTKRVKISNALGVHASYATGFVHTANGFESEILVKAAGGHYSANAKSLVMLLSLGLARGMTIEITAEGPDEQQAVDALVALTQRGLGE